MRTTLVLLLLAGPAMAQVTARQATPEQQRVQAEAVGERVREEVPSPLFLEVPLRTKNGMNVLQLFKLGSGVWRTEETDAFVCDKAHVEVVEITPGRARKGMIPLTAAATFATDWFRQDIDVTMRLQAPGGDVLATGSWHRETIGNDVQIGYGGVTKTLKIETKISTADFDRFAASSEPLVLTISMAIQE